jgi:hypothetical protein
MTLQDFVETINSTLTYFGSIIFPSFFPIFVFIFVLFIGIVAASIFNFVWLELIRILDLEKNLRKIFLYSSLVKENPKNTLTNLISRFIWLTTTAVFVVAALQAVGFKELNFVLRNFSNFAPIFAGAILILVLGIVFAYLSYLIVEFLGGLAKLPAVGLISKASSLVVIVFSTFQALLYLRVESETLRWIAIGTIAAFSLAAGLIARDKFKDFNVKKFLEGGD